MTTRRGFTLVEMLVSMALGSLVLLLAITSLRSTGDSYERSTGSVGAEREARAVLTQAAEDLSKAVRGDEALFEEGDGGWRKDRLGFLTLQPADAQAERDRLGDLCAVVYYVKDLEFGRDTVRCLMRGFRGSSETFAALRDGQVETLYELEARDEPVSFGVLGFEATPLKRAAAGEWEEWKQAAGDASQLGPAAVRLRLVVARRELVGKLRTAGDWDGGSLVGEPAEAERSRLLETYEVIQAFGHES